jgi:hypothetical protein
MWNEFLPMSMPITAIWALAVLGMGVLLDYAAPVQRQPLAGQEHGRTIPLRDLARTSFSMLRRLSAPERHCADMGWARSRAETADALL